MLRNTASNIKRHQQRTKNLNLCQNLTNSMDSEMTAWISVIFSIFQGYVTNPLGVFYVLFAGKSWFRSPGNWKKPLRPTTCSSFSYSFSEQKRPMDSENHPKIDPFFFTLKLSWHELEKIFTNIMGHSPFKRQISITGEQPNSKFKEDFSDEIISHVCHSVFAPNECRNSRTPAHLWITLLRFAIYKWLAE